MYIRNNPDHSLTEKDCERSSARAMSINMLLIFKTELTFGNDSEDVP
jgi:hypothetical protein